jgi:hypothetical protein
MSVPWKSDIATATILMAALVTAVFIAHRPSSTDIKVGDILKGTLPDADWRKDGRTLILVISTECYLCRASSPFYRTLAAQAGSNVNIIAVFPETTGEAEKYLKDQGVRVDHVEHLELHRIGVDGTPTLILTNAAGVVRNVWFGELQPEQQSQVLAILASTA